MGQEIKLPYSEEGVNDIYDYLLLQEQRGEAVAFEVILDKFKLVRKTFDPERLLDYQKFVKPGISKELDVQIYNYGESHHYDRTKFYFDKVPDEVEDSQKKEKTKSLDQGLSGLEVERIVNERVGQIKQDMEISQLKKDLAVAEETVKERDKEIEELEEALDKLELEKAEMLARESPLKGVLGEMGAGVVESFIKRNPQTLAKLIPGGESLSGLIEEDEKHRLQRLSLPASQESEVVFSEKSNPASNDPAYILVQNIRAQFTDQEFAKVLQILDVLIVDKSRLDTVHSLVTEN